MQRRTATPDRRACCSEGLDWHADINLAALGEPRGTRIAVLADDRGDAITVSNCDAEPGRRSEIEDVEA
jgi:hypothetical protein